MFQSKLTTFASALILAGSVFAVQPQPSTCPNINDIKAEGLSMAGEITSNYFMTYHVSKYNTPFRWGFVIAPIKAHDESNALETASEILSNMSAPGLPEQQGTQLVCEYETGHDDLFAIAANDVGQLSPRYLNSLLMNKVH